jgi:hypothetical protein
MGYIYGNNGPYGTPPQMIEMPPQREEAKRVNGRNGAEMYRMAPNSSAVLLDENNPMIWFLQTDSAGYKTITPYDISPHVDEQPPDVRSIDEKINGLDERLRAIEEALK